MPLSRYLFLLPLALSVTAEESGGIAGRDTACTSVHIFLAKGNNEPYPGRQGKLVTAICSGLPSCDYEDIQWNNALEVEYCAALEEGAVNGAAQIRAYAQRCPDSKLVVSGYSQGGHLVGDILGGGGGTFFQGCVQTPNPGLDRNSSPGNKIAAALIFGDTRHTASQSYNFETGSGANGLFPRPAAQLAGMEQYSSVMRSYCVVTDPICAGGDVVETHLNYFDVFSDSVGVWVRGMVSDGESSSPTTSTKTTSSRQTTSTTRPPTSSSTSTTITTTTPTSSLVDPDESMSSSAAAPSDQPDTTTSASPSETSTDTNDARSVISHIGWAGLVVSCVLAFS